MTIAPLDPREEAFPLGRPLVTADDVAAPLAAPRSSVYEYARRLHDPLPLLRIGRHRRGEESQQAWNARVGAAHFRAWEKRTTGWTGSTATSWLDDQEIAERASR